MIPWPNNNQPVLMVHVRLLDPLVLGAPVLEPDLDLCLGQVERLGELEAARPRDVLVALVLQLQPQRLVRRERRPLPPLAGVLAAPPGH